ncbi:hypothetical protein D6T64_17390 [Cryobacterium melibiosiphilum]|uniref:Uncharacterized protein n=1 Tax=Cryobacterium melibiosiphilum TaxID=995039 RepID=A0A3A5MJB8_9MICO|nr:hypothetical protein [Cryobacterium melibiosiphilum]RJT86903.1 hypothetical protein D6T64_17390 [Cryobacterium melibiosiphilum]
MGVPRITFTRFSSAGSAKLAPWREHRRRVIERTGPTATGPTTESADRSVVWQLLSANNRELARSADVYVDFISARASAVHAAEGVASRGTVTLVSDDQRGAYGWFVDVDQVTEIVCARWYVAERERRHAVELTLASLPLARIADGARQHVEWQLPAPRVASR